MSRKKINKPNRAGGVYIAVLGSSLVIGLLGITALVGQRIQNRVVVASADIRQAQLNANSAVEMGLLIMKQESNWRTGRSSGPWFTARETGAGTCSLEVTDPIDGNLSNDPNDPVVVVGVGYRGDAQQRVQLTVEPQPQALSSLRSAIAAGSAIDMQGDTLRTDGLITANQVTATASQVYGDVEAVTVSGSTFAGTTTQIDSAKLPTMPNWSTVFDYYRQNGTEINIALLPTTPTSNFARNPGVESAVVANDPNWTGTPPGMPAATAQVARSSNWKHAGSNSLRVSSRTSWQSGAVQRIENFVKPGQQYDVEAWAHPNPGGLLGSGNRDFNMTLHVKGTNDANALVVTTPNASATWVTIVLTLSSSPARITGRLTVPTWSGDLEYAFVKIADASSSGGTDEFYADDLSIREVTAGKYLFRKVLGPGINPYGSLNPQGIYWINCGGQRLTIDRSRIFGTLLIINPGANSGVASGPIHWSPVVAGYPALLVDADDPSSANFKIGATNRVLSEFEQNFNFNPAGAAHYQFATDADMNDIYPTGIRGLVAIEGDFSFQHRPLIHGQLLVGGNVANSNGELDIEYQPDSLLNPPPGFLAPYSHARRPGSVKKAVLP
jgi:Carbohydrate binding domain